MVNDIQIAMRLDAAAPIGVQTPALVDVLNARLSELGQQRLSVRPTDTADGPRPVGAVLGRRHAA